jgi:hypothetical protein
MTLDQLNARMVIGVARPDLTANGVDDYTAILNEAQKEICRLHSFTWMKDTADVTIPANDSVVSLPASFKELTRTKTPVHLFSDDGTPATPVDVWTLEKLRRFARSTLTTQIAVALDWSFLPPKLTLICTADEDLSFQVSHYAYPDDLEDGEEESNILTTQYPEMLLAKAKAIAFAAVNDPITADLESLFQLKFREARASDCHADLAGIDLHM